MLNQDKYNFNVGIQTCRFTKYAFALIQHGDSILACKIELASMTGCRFRFGLLLIAQNVGPTKRPVRLG